MMIWSRVMGDVLAACDEDALGKEFAEGKISLHVKESFYGDSLISDAEFKRLLREKQNINLVGKNAIRMAREEGLLDGHGSVEGVPYAIIIKM